MASAPYGSSYDAGSVPVATTDGTLARRAFAYLVDLVMIGLLILILGFAITLLGFVTFGLGWALFAVLVPATFVLYNAVTISGSAQATIGMRMMGVYAADAASGRGVPFLNAAVHALLFYLAVGMGMLLWLVDVAIGLGRSDSRLGRDLLTGMVFLRRP